MIGSKNSLPASTRCWSLAGAVAALLAISATVDAQSPTAVHRADSAILKISALTLIGIPTVGVERRLADPSRTFQWDVSLSPWSSVRGTPMQFLIGVAEWRYYARPDREGLYTGLHVGGALFRLQKWNYRDTTLYQEGGSFLGGGVVGGRWTIAHDVLVDVWLGGGTVQSLYKGYDLLTRRRYDGAKLWNISGELLPYRTGIAIGIPFG